MRKLGNICDSECYFRSNKIEKPNAEKRKIPQRDIDDLCASDSRSMEYYVTSAKNGDGVHEMFAKVIRKWLVREAEGYNRI
jgi:hypothetical protein